MIKSNKSTIDIFRLSQCWLLIKYSQYSKPDEKIYLTQSIYRQIALCCHHERNHPTAHTETTKLNGDFGIIIGSYIPC